MSDLYTSQLSNYNEKYDNAISKINNIRSLLDGLYQSFNGASGSDIDKIRNDLTNICNKLNNIKTQVTNAKNKSNTNATNSDQVYDKACLENGIATPTFSDNNYYYRNTSPRRVYYEDGIIYATETFEQVPKEHIDNLTGPLVQLFSSYKTINSTLQASVDKMINGELHWLSALNKTKVNDPNHS